MRSSILYVFSIVFILTGCSQSINSSNLAGVYCSMSYDPTTYLDPGEKLDLTDSKSCNTISGITVITKTNNIYGLLDNHFGKIGQYENESITLKNGVNINISREKDKIAFLDVRGIPMRWLIPMETKTNLLIEQLGNDIEAAGAYPFSPDGGFIDTISCLVIHEYDQGTPSYSYDGCGNNGVGRAYVFSSHDYLISIEKNAHDNLVWHVESTLNYAGFPGSDYNYRGYENYQWTKSADGYPKTNKVKEQIPYHLHPNVAKYVTKAFYLQRGQYQKEREIAFAPYTRDSAEAYLSYYKDTVLAELPAFVLSEEFFRKHPHLKEGDR